MRFDCLDLLRYGALTDRMLQFNPAASLHIVYGPNEAGKSSALSAIGDLLFGYPRATAHYSFLHDPAQLRIGAAIAARNGETLRFRRRRGTKNTLLADDDKETALREDALVPFLGSLNREIFKRAFGLDSHDLREGGRAMLESGGEIGTLLFSAASGLMGLRKLRQSLDDEAATIFGPRKKQEHSFFQAVERYDNARHSESQLELRSSDWKKLVGEAGELEAQLASLQEERRKSRARLEQLRGLKKLQPLVQEIDRETAALAAFSDLDGLPAGFAEALTQALDQRRTATDSLRREAETVERLSTESGGIEVDAGLLAVAAEITTLFADTGGYTKARRDLPAIEREVATYDANLSHLARRLGLGDAEELESRQPSDADLARLKRLADSGQSLARATADLARQQAAEQERLAALDEAGDLGRLIDPKPYAERLAALSDELAALARLDGLYVQVERAREALALSGRRLKPAVDDVERLLARPLPELAFISRFGQRQEKIEAERRAAATRLTTLATEAAEIEETLDDAEGAVVTRDDILALRVRRDRQFAALGPKSTDEDRAVVADLIAYADRLADTAEANADRLSRHAEARLRLSRIERQSEEARAALDAAEAQAGQCRADFEAQFADAGIVPLTVEAMLDWRRGVDELFRQQAAISVMEDQIAIVARGAERIAPVLQGIADAIGVEGQGLPVTALAQAIQRQITALGERWAESRSRDGERRAAQRRVSDLEMRQSELFAQSEDWREHFSAACSVVGLRLEWQGESPQAEIDMALAALEAWRAVPELLLERENRRRRVAGMQRDNGSYEKRVAAVIGTVDPSLATLAADAAISLVHEKAIAARTAHQKKQALDENLSEARARHQRAETAMHEAESRIEELAKALPSGDLDAALPRLSERARHLERLQERRLRLDAQAEGRGEAELRALLSGFDPVAAGLEIEALEEEENRQFEKHGELVARRSQNEREREALETGASAEHAVFEKQAAQEEARDLARQWVVLKLASSMLAKSMEAYRERHADPVMQRAGEHFSALTGGRFARLLQEYDERDELRLMVERQGGERVPLEGLSEGTGDQLFLALRLAFLEDYATRNEPAPLIVDDIFQTFDDERVALGLKTLAATGERFQTIVFTHQASVVDLARRELGAAADIVPLQ
ncbi:AAA family ATPase [Rhizobium sp. YJ-22]|uniref:ATP-binding protein n=1 Tax=Rhizobium sp. YJ-22 TaxID=3037556 RepID=UPI002412A403|nr:YhaN family protein [Rhizobium sp. YJ-22]MDG3577167.1 AAA family ATPase [Rhizobium sp. YJ-22]